MTYRAVSSALVAGMALVAAPAVFAQAVPGIGVADRSAIIGSSNAFKGAMQQLPIAYKTQIDQINTRVAQLQAQIKPLVDKLNADSKLPKPDRAALEAQYNQIQQIQEAGKRELQQLQEPYNLGRQFAIEQIEDKLDVATQAAMTKSKVTLVLDVQSVLKSDLAYNLNVAILEQLNLIVPTVSVNPPAGWLPRQLREQQAQQQAAAAEAAQAAAAAPAPAATPPKAATAGKKQPEGR